MALDKITFHLPFAEGQEQRAGEVYLPAPRLAKLQDMTLDKTGEANKRLGTDQLDTDTTAAATPLPGDANGIGVRDETELVQVNDRELFAHTQNNNDMWAPRGDAWCVGTRQHRIPSEYGESGDDFIDTVVAYGRLEDYEIFWVYREGFVIRDANTKAFIYRRDIDSSASLGGVRIRVDHANQAFYLVWSSAADEISALRIRLSNILVDPFGIASTISLTTSNAIQDPHHFDVEWDANNNRLVGVAYESSVLIEMFSYSQDLSVKATASVGAQTNRGEFAVTVLDGRAYVFYYDYNLLLTRYLRFADNSISAPTVLETSFAANWSVRGGAVATGTGASGKLWLFYESGADETNTTPTLPNTGTRHVHRISVTDPAGTPVVAAHGFLKNSFLFSRPAIYDVAGEQIPLVMVGPSVGKPYSGSDAGLTWILGDSGRGDYTTSSAGFGDSIYLALYDGRYGYEDLSATQSMQPLARMVPGELFDRDVFAAALGPTRDLCPRDLMPHDTTNKAFSYACSTEAGITLFDFDLEDPQAYESVSAGESLYFPGGYLTAYDGERLKEAAPFLYPDNISVKPAFGTVLTATNEYVYAFYWVIRNAQNEIIRSTALPVRVTAAAAINEEFVFRVRTITHTRLPADTKECWLEVYRSGADPADTTDPRFLVSGSPAYGTVEVNFGAGPVSLPATVYNDPTASSVLFADSVVLDDVRAPDEWGLTPADPNNAGVIDTVPALAPRSLHTGQNRLFYVGPEVGGDEIYYSKLRSGGEMFGFNEGLATPIPEPGGELTGIYPAEGKVTVFRSRSTAVLPGVGPDNLGRGTYGLAEVIDAATGLTDARAMAQIPGGLMFHSERGWHFLNRADQLSFIGTGVDDLRFDAAGEYSAGCVVVPEQHKVICYSSAADRTVVFDWLVQQWAQYTGEYAARSARLFDGVPHWVRTSGGKVNYPSTDHRDDETATNIGGLIETAWLKVDQGQGRFGQGGISGWGRNYWWELVGEADTVGGGDGNPFPIEPIKVRVAYNYEASSTGPVWEETLYYLVYSGRFRIRERFKGSRQKSAAVKFEISGFNSGGTASIYNLTLHALSMQVGLKSGVTRGPASPA